MRSHDEDASPAPTNVRCLVAICFHPSGSAFGITTFLADATDVSPESFVQAAEVGIEPHLVPVSEGLT